MLLSSNEEINIYMNILPQTICLHNFELENKFVQKCKKIYLDKNLFEQNQMMMTTDLVCVDASTGKIFVKYERGGPSVKDNKSREESIETYKKVREFSIKNPFQGGGCSGK